jgi:hypothetical protein
MQLESSTEYHNTGEADFHEYFGGARDVVVGTDRMQYIFEGNRFKTIDITRVDFSIAKLHPKLNFLSLISQEVGPKGIARNETSVFQNIPYDIQLLIFLNVSLADVAHSMQSCKEWNTLLNLDLFWSKRLSQDFQINRSPSALFPHCKFLYKIHHPTRLFMPLEIDQHTIFANFAPRVDIIYAHYRQDAQAPGELERIVANQQRFFAQVPTRDAPLLE